MNTTFAYNTGRDLRVRTKVYVHGQPEEIESPQPLHPGVRAYLDSRPEVTWLQIYDGPGYGKRFMGYYRPHPLGRKIYYVPYAKSKDGVMVGPGLVMLFDQATGELLYDGSDGGE